MLHAQVSPMSVEANLKAQYPVSSPFAIRYGAAIDLGTSTIALALCRVPDGAVIAVEACENPQRMVSSDVVGRIEAAMRGLDRLMRESTLSAMEGLLLATCTQAGIAVDQVDSLVVTGNTSMLHVLVGQDVECLSRAPFVAERLFDEELEILGRKAYLPPCFGAFVGADLACALLSSGVTQSGATGLLCDLGTNGEVALWSAGTLYVASTAAGPCFEGVGLGCGCPSIPGAIDSVWLEDDALRFGTIGDAPPVGICGSGIIEACAAMLRRGDLSESGRLACAELSLCDEVRIDQSDIRSVQLAKAAIAAGIDSLINAAGLVREDVSDFVICGGLGSSLNMVSASDIGLVPLGFVPKARVLGNAALEGAVMLLLDGEKRAIIDEMRRCVLCVPLAGDDYFGRSYIEHMVFDQTEEEY